MDAVLDQPNTRPKNRGKKLAASAFLAQGFSQRKTAELSGLSVPTVRQISRQRIVPSSQVEPIKRELRNRFALLADRALGKVSDEKLDEASAYELVKVADLATKNAGLAPPQVHETYSAHITKYVKSTGSSSQDAGIIETSDHAKVSAKVSQVIDK